MQNIYDYIDSHAETWRNQFQAARPTRAGVLGLRITPTR